ncbi:hypothetical protein Clacol_001161 [Clathrus columnatus]|uniref:ubiquitinyl hydrolase 1 n=1 Tax=Clathrus columnatus TaxID=1419009 RepID=A0AAV5A100_9AGAM|nr:hypothetical protein Clacol_001161 [Clathrus columnatus]
MRTGIDVRGVLDTIHWHQFLPILVILVTPLIIFGVYNHQAKSLRWAWVLWITTMVLENIGLGFAWNWVYGHELLSSKPVPKLSSSSSSKKKMRRSDSIKTQEVESSDGSSRYPGIVNISGTYCFMNSTLQAMASLTYLQPHIEVIHSRAEQYDVPTPVIDAFRDVLTALNTLSPTPRPLRPDQLLNAFSTYDNKTTRNALFYSREHQDAQEFFQLLSETIKNEGRAVEEEATRDLGLGALSRCSDNDITMEMPGFVKNGVFDGLTANRRSCVECGYTEAVMHFAFDNWQLVVPRMANCRLEECLSDYTRLEVLDDCICRKCSIIATHQRLLAEAQKLSDAVAEGDASTSKKKKAKEVRKLETRVKAAIEEGRIEEDIKGVKMEKVFSRCSTRQSMIARPPPVLALHLSRSIQYGTSGVKNTCRVFYPEYLDLTPFTTSGELSTLPSLPISDASTSTTLIRPLPQILYRLSAVVCHYGTHSFGHYVAYRRKPKPPLDEHRFDPPRLKCSPDCACEKCQQGEDPYGSRWLRISDESVEEVGVERALAENSGVYMLYYERMVMPPQQSRPPLLRSSPSSVSSSYSSSSVNGAWSVSNSNSTSSIAWLGRNTPHSSEETITPANSSLYSRKNSSSPPPSLPETSDSRSTPFEARVIHRVHAGRSGSRSRSGASTPSLMGDVSASSSRIFVNGNVPISLEAKLPNGTTTNLPNGDSHSTLKDLPSIKTEETETSLTGSSSASQQQTYFRHSTQTLLSEAGLSRTTGLQA